MEIVLDLDHLSDYDPDLAEAVMGNTRRYAMLLSDAVWEMLPDYRQREPTARDNPDVYINQRIVMEARSRQNAEWVNQPAITQVGRFLFLCSGPFQLLLIIVCSSHRT